MADDLGKRGGPDRTRINVEEAHEVRHWCQRFGCTEEQLRAAVGRVGVMAADVESYLASARHGSQAPQR